MNFSDSPLLQLDRVTYPVLSLPPEIISAIFVQCLPLSKDDPHPLHFPMLLMHICRTWRSIAISTHSLWTTLTLDITPHDNIADPVAFINAWLGHAGRLPLSLSLRGEIEEDVGPGCLRNILDLHAPQLQSLALHVDAQDLANIANTGPFPILQKLIIGLPFREGEDMLSQEVSLIAPVLREVSLVNGAVPSLFAIRLWQRLTKFSGESLPADDVLVLFLGAPHLVECSISVDAESAILGPEENDDPIAHSTLETFHLRDYSSATILRYLTLPALQNLYLTDIDELDNSYFVPFLSRSSASLRCFTFGPDGRDLSQDVPSVQWFSITSGLTNLELRKLSGQFARDFFQMLNRGQHAEFLPNLRALACVDCLLYIDEILLRALSSRSSGVCRLESFRQVYPRQSYMSVLLSECLALRELVSQGMEIHVGMAGANLI
ncbi:hypothetical protein C8J57DRAFT_758206 [Mycena rebaudengoi]|nr:hypothetical protein C8J57DRAFT_758206 [Mycena rebaudengoi]